MKNFLLKNRYYAIPPLVLLTGGYIYLKSYVANNKKEFYHNYEITRDTTRPGNKSFGLNYGYKTDSAVTIT